MLLRLISYLTEVKSICLTSRSFKFRCHSIVMNLAEVEGSANGRHRFVFFLCSWSNTELKIFMGEVIPSSKPPSASLPAFSHPSLCVDVKRQPWGSQTQTMWSLRGPAEDLPTTFLPNLPDASCLCSRFVVSDISLSLFFSLNPAGCIEGLVVLTSLGGQTPGSRISTKSGWNQSSWRWHFRAPGSHTYSWCQEENRSLTKHLFFCRTSVSCYQGNHFFFFFLKGSSIQCERCSKYFLSLDYTVGGTGRCSSHPWHL